MHIKAPRSFWSTLKNADWNMRKMVNLRTLFIDCTVVLLIYILGYGSNLLCEILFVLNVDVENYSNETIELGNDRY